MKNLILISSLMLALASYSYAMPEQHRSSPMLLDKLELSSQQQEKLTQLMNKHRTDMDKLRDKEQTAVKKLMDNQRKELSTVLTAEQMTQFDKMQKIGKRRRLSTQGGVTTRYLIKRFIWLKLAKQVRLANF